MASNSRRKVLDALEGLSSDDDASTSEAEDEKDEEAPATKKAKQDVTIEDLEKAGYTSGPSVLYMKAPQEQQQSDWAWSDGKDKKGKEQTEESIQERQQTAAAAGPAAEASAVFATKAMQQAAKLREEARKERERLAQEKRLSFNQKEKRKRDAGQASRGKNYVEEEKRQARNFGVFSGFD